MIRYFITLLVLSIFKTACNSDQKKVQDESNSRIIAEIIEHEDDTIIFEITGVKSYIDGVDSLIILTANGNELFKIAEDGNIEILSDTVVQMGISKIGIITLADYFQDNQIFYVIYNPIDSILLQSSRLYLPYIGLDITQYKQLDSITLDGDSLLIKSHIRPEIKLMFALDTLICNREGIINYYEFE